MLVTRMLVLDIRPNSEKKLASASSARNWWSILKESVLKLGSSISSIQSDNGTLVSDPLGNAAFLSKLFIKSSLEMLSPQDQA